MKILFLSHYFPPEGNAPATRTHAHCRRWVEAGHEVTVITCAPNVPDGVVYPGYRNQWRREEIVDGIRVVRIWTYLAPNKGRLRRILNYVSFMLLATWHALRVPRPDVLIATSPQFFNGLAGVLVRRLRRLPFVLEIRDIWPESIAAVGAMQGRGVLGFLEWLARWMYAAADRIVTVGAGYRDALLGKGVPAEKMDIVMNGLDLDELQPQAPDPELRRRWGLEGKFVCAYVGTIGLAAALETVLKAAERLRTQGRRDIIFLLVGDGAARADLEREARARGLENVIFTGRQDKELIPGYLALADACLVHLRRTELFTIVMPSKIFEAAGMARPIVNGVAGFAAEFVRRAGAGLCIEPENDGQLAQAVLQLAADPELCRRLGAAGCAHVREHYDRDRLARDYLAILERVRRAGAGGGDGGTA